MTTHFSSRAGRVGRLLSAGALTAMVFLPTASARPRANLPERPPQADVNAPALRQTPGLKPSRDLLFNGWGMSPAGRQIAISDLPLKLVIAPDGETAAAVSAGFNDPGLTLINLRSGAVSQFVPMVEAWNGLAFSRDGRRLFVSTGSRGEVTLFRYAHGRVEFERAVKPRSSAPQVFLASIAVQPRSGELYVCNEANHEIWQLNRETLAFEKAIAVGQHPHTCVFGADDRYLYVSNWGSRSVSVVDVETGRRVRDLTVGIRPNDMVLSKDGRLFVACSGDNTVHVIQTRSLERSGPDAGPARRLWEGTREIISTSLYPQSPEGSTPDAVAVSPDGRTLFVANADNNCVMVADISNSLSEQSRENHESVSVVDGFIPAGWYPSALAVAPDNQTLLVGNGKGLGSRANFPARTQKPEKLHKPPAFDYIGRMLEGAISLIARPDARQMAAYTEQVRRNSPYRPAQFHQAPISSAGPIPATVGAPCPIKYVVYIIKENRTYDQVFGDMTDARGEPIGNGDPNLCMYGEKITPNQHALARDYVLIDNLYCNGEVSVDGHSWCDAAIATDFNERSWIISYSSHGKLPGNEEMETPANGYLWDLCRRHGVTFKNYGEGAQRVPSANRGRWAGARDFEKVNGWIEDLKKAETSGDLPQFVIMSLGENHTKGTTPGAFTPDACVASNDLALGRLVEAATRSRFWPEMAIFVIEDDAQNGPDHVDAHRTVGLVLSPYCRRGAVDGALYTTASMVRTMELILGLPPLTQYDAGATPMFNCFQESSRVVPFHAMVPDVDLYAKNTARSPFAKQSARMDFRQYDRAPEDELNRILWHLAKGLDTPYPTPIHRALFTR